jgi:hypothetical protein
MTRYRLARVAACAPVGAVLIATIARALTIYPLVPGNYARAAYGRSDPGGCARLSAPIPSHRDAQMQLASSARDGNTAEVLRLVAAGADPNVKIGVGRAGEPRAACLRSTHTHARTHVPHRTWPRSAGLFPQTLASPHQGARAAVLRPRTRTPARMHSDSFGLGVCRPACAGRLHCFDERRPVRSHRHGGGDCAARRLHECAQRGAYLPAA